MPFGWTFVAISVDLDHQEILARVKSIWEIVASWGRVWNDPQDSLLSDEEYADQLPDWIHRQFPEFVDWIPYLLEREWIWWSSVSSNEYIKIDLLVEALPISVGVFERLMEVCGGKIAYSDLWIGTSEAEELIGESK